jgi:hypothetical protein
VEVSGQFHASASLSPWKEPLVPTGRQAGPQSLSGGRDEEKLKLGIIYYYGVFNKDKKVELSLRLNNYQATNMPH